MARQTREDMQAGLARFFADNPSIEARFLSVLERIESDLYDLGESIPELTKAVTARKTAPLIDRATK